VGLLAWVGLVPLMVAISGRSSGLGFLLSYICGIIFFAGVFTWIFDVAGYKIWHHAVLGVFFGLYFGFFGWAFNFISKRLGIIYGYFAAPFFWVCLEYLRSNLSFMALPLPLLAHSQYQFPVIIQIASLTGAYGISFLVVSVNAALSAMFFASVRSTGINAKKRPTHSLLSKRGKIAIMLSTASVVAFVLLYGKLNLSEPHTGKMIKVSVVQGNIDRQKKLNPRRHKKFIMQRYADLTKKASKDGAALIVWPEAATPGFVLKKLPLMKKTVSLIRETKTHFIIGSSEYPKFIKERFDPKKYGNTAIFFSPEGKVLGQYLKIKLTPFGEFIPYDEIIPWPKFIVPEGKKSFELPGEDHTIFELNGAKFGVIICWESHFPGLFRAFVKKGANFMLNITNEGWFGEAGLYQKMVTSVFRAVENRVSIARAANTGVSCFIDPYGRITGRVQNNGKDILVEGYLTQNIPLSHERTFYTSYGDVFVYLSIIMMGLIIVLSIFRSKKRP